MNTFSSFKPNSNQNQAFNQMQRFITGNDSVFILKGYAGTGKTALIEYLVAFLEKIERAYKLLAPTGRAARVIKERIKRPAYTIHKTIYAFDRLLESKPEPYAEDDLLLFNFGICENIDDRDTVYIIDEASMISDQISNSGYLKFGSGKLLSDLIEYTQLKRTNFNRKIIFIGDPAQLPPINMTLSPALDARYLSDKFSINAIQEFTLTQVFRQQEASGILSCARYLRNYIESNCFPSFELPTEYSDVVCTYSPDFVDKYLGCSAVQETDQAIIITYTNELAHRYNHLVRHKLFPNARTIKPGDRIIVVQNNYYKGIELLNGEFGVVKDVDYVCDEHVVTLKSHNRTEKVSLFFREVELEFKNIDGEAFSINTLILENQLNSPRLELNPLENRALIVDFYRRNPHVRNDKEQLLIALRHDPFINALKVKYGYAITGHKAQGGEWQKVFIDFSSSTNIFCSNYFRWAYTAITRARERLYFINYCQIGPLDGITEIKPTMPLDEQQEDIPVKPVQGENITGLLDEAITKMAAAKGWRISSIESYQYRQRYFIDKGDVIVRADVIYRSNYQISQVECGNATTAAQELVPLLKSLIGKNIKALGNESENITFSPAQPFLEELYNQIKNKLTGTNVTIESVEHFPFMERYVFRAAADTARINFYYNKSGKITSVKYEGKNNSERVVNIIKEALG